MIARFRWGYNWWAWRADNPHLPNIDNYRQDYPLLIRLWEFAQKVNRR